MPSSSKRSGVAVNAFERGFHIGVWSGIAVFVLGLVAGGYLAAVLH